MSTGHAMRLRLTTMLLMAAWAMPSAAQHGVWLEGFPYRRGADLQTADEPRTAEKPTPDKPPAAKLNGDELTRIEFYTAGHAKPNGDDMRVATEEGRIVPSRVLMTGPGDRASVVFAPVKGIKRYNVFFGHPQPPPKPKGTEDVPLKSGLLLEMKLRNGPADNAPQIEGAWAQSSTPVGQTMLDALFVGYNPFEDRGGTISRVRSTLTCPFDGVYLFALSAQDRGCLVLDGKAVLFGAGLVGTIEHNAQVELKRGPHAMVFYHAGEGDGRFSVVWKRPDSDKIEVIPPEAFGLLGKAVVGPLEEIRKTVTADFKADYAGECFYENHYSYRYQFAAVLPRGLAAPVKYDWNFGDGQTAAGPTVEHVYLDDGIYPVTLTARVGTTVETQTTRFAARRDREKLVNPPTDLPTVQSVVVAGYDIQKLPPAHLPWAVLLHQRAEAFDLMLPCAEALARVDGGIDPTIHFGALQVATDAVLARPQLAPTQAAAALAIWDRIPAGAVIKPRAVKYQAGLLLWYAAYFGKALRVLEPYAASDDVALRRLRGQALVLAGKEREGRALLAALPIEGPPEREAAISGAMARTVEYHILEKDWESGEATWANWQARYPHDFLTGYSVMLQSRLMEIRGVPVAAARVAEAFAAACPKSSYAPQLLDRASRLLEGADPIKSAALRATLRQRYPEDPLSQSP